MPRPKGRRRKYWGPHQWTPPSATASGPSPWAEVESALAKLAETDAILRLSGEAGKWEITLHNGRVVTVLAETDEAARVEAAILGAER